jgi:hypothetical protein
MALEQIPSKTGWGRPTPDYGKLEKVLKELQGRKFTVVNGAGDGVDIPVAGISAQDTLASVVRLVNGIETRASVATGQEVNNNAVRWTSKVPGEAGNLIGVVLKDPGAASQALAVSVSGSVVTVSLATDAGAAITSTAAEVIAAVNGDPTASALLSAGNEGVSDGTGVVAALAETHLAGGAGTPTGLDDQVGNATIPADGSVRIVGVDTSRDRLLVVWHDKDGA